MKLHCKAKVSRNNMSAESRSIHKSLGEHCQVQMQKFWECINRFTLLPLHCTWQSGRCIINETRITYVQQGAIKGGIFSPVNTVCNAALKASLTLLLSKIQCVALVYFTLQPSLSTSFAQNCQCVAAVSKSSHMKPWLLMTNLFLREHLVWCSK